MANFNGDDFGHIQRLLCFLAESQNWAENENDAFKRSFFPLLSIKIETIFFYSFVANHRSGMNLIFLSSFADMHIKKTTF